MKRCFYTKAYNGLFEGKPAFLGYFFGVKPFLLITTNDLLESPSSNFSTFTIFPPSTLIAFLEELISSSQSPDLYEINCPPVFTKGRQYSDKVER